MNDILLVTNHADDHKNCKICKLRDEIDSVFKAHSASNAEIAFVTAEIAAILLHEAEAHNGQYWAISMAKDMSEITARTRQLMREGKRV